MIQYKCSRNVTRKHDTEKEEWVGPLEVSISHARGRQKRFSKMTKIELFCFGSIKKIFFIKKIEVQTGCNHFMTDKNGLKKLLKSVYKSVILFHLDE